MVKPETRLWRQIAAHWKKTAPPGTLPVPAADGQLKTIQIGPAQDPYIMAGQELLRNQYAVGLAVTLGAAYIIGSNPDVGVRIGNGLQTTTEGVVMGIANGVIKVVDEILGLAAKEVGMGLEKTKEAAAAAAASAGSLDILISGQDPDKKDLPANWGMLEEINFALGLAARRGDWGSYLFLDRQTFLGAPVSPGSKMAVDAWLRNLGYRFPGDPYYGLSAVQIQSLKQSQAQNDAFVKARQAGLR